MKVVESKPKPKTMLDFVKKQNKPQEKSGGVETLASQPITSLRNFGVANISKSSTASISQKENGSSDELNSQENTSLNTNSQPGNNEAKAASSDAWKKLLKGPEKAPLCKGHREPCVGNKVKKPGPNFGKTFYACARPTGLATNKEARCNHFEWAK